MSLYDQMKLCQIFDKYLPYIQYYFTKTTWNLQQKFNSTTDSIVYLTITIIASQRYDSKNMTAYVEFFLMKFCRIYDKKLLKNGI